MRKAAKRRLARQRDRFRILLNDNEEKFTMAWCNYVNGMVIEIRRRTGLINEREGSELIGRTMDMLKNIGDDALKLQGSKTFDLLSNIFGRSIADACNKNIYIKAQNYTEHP